MGKPVTGITRGWINSLDTTELFIFKALHTHKEHLNCRLVIKETYCDRYGTPALYCVDHDHFITWMKSVNEYYPLEFSSERLEILGINNVIYPNDGSHDRMIDETGYGNKIKTTTITNFRTGKKTKIWIGYKGNPYRDPSMSEYWDFIESFL